MAIGIGVAIAAILHGLGVVGTKVWEATKSFVGWMIGVMPGPLKFFFFLYMLLFLASTIMPVFLGTGFSCTSDGEAYEINFLTLQAKSSYIDSMAEICAPTDYELTFSDYTEAMSGNPVQKAVLTIKRIWQTWTQYREGNYTSVDPLCEEFDALYDLEDNSTDVSIKDTVLKYYGEPIIQEGYEKVIKIGCSQNREGEWYPSLLFYTIDLLSYQLWLLLGVVGAIVPFSFRWYRIVMKR